MYISEYMSDNWILLLTLLGYSICLISTVFLDKKTVRRSFALILEVLLLSIIVYAEFKIAGSAEFRMQRLILMALRYSATPFLIAQIIYTVIRRQHWVVFMPAAAVAVINVISIFTGIVFGLDDANKLVRGPLGLLPFIAPGLYCATLVFLLIKHSSRQRTEIVPIIFFAFAFASGLILPFTIGSDYSKVFCETIAVSMFVYYVFSLLQLTKRDALTGLLNRQAYYADVRSEPENITAMVSVDMNGLKAINDKEGHKAGDEALSVLSDCFLRAAKNKFRVYRVGGDEFIIVCRKCDEDEVKALSSRISEAVAQTKYSCSIGYSYSGVGAKSIDDMLKASDEKMYEAKEKHYQELGVARRER